MSKITQEQLFKYLAMHPSEDIDLEELATFCGMVDDNNTKDEIFSASQEMIKKLIDDNEINIDDIASIIF